MLFLAKHTLYLPILITSTFYEHEADILEEKVNRIIFAGNHCTELAEKLQLKDFVNEIASISDEAENIGEKLTIFAIKREI